MQSLEKASCMRCTHLCMLQAMSEITPFLAMLPCIWCWDERFDLCLWALVVKHCFVSVLRLVLMESKLSERTASPCCAFNHSHAGRNKICEKNVSKAGGHYSQVSKTLALRGGDEEHELRSMRETVSRIQVLHVQQQNSPTTFWKMVTRFIISTRQH